MKFKLFLICGALVAMTTMTSCKKDWNCQCTTGSVVTNTEIKDQTLLNARSKCKSMEGSAFGASTTCKID